MQSSTIGATFAESVAAGHSPRHRVDCQNEVGYARVVALSKQFSTELASLNVSYGVHGMFGIFADGDPINRNTDGSFTPHTVIRAGKRINIKKASYVNYSHVKTRMLYTAACEHINQVVHRARGSHVRPTICELGFNAGLSAMLLLEAAPAARVISFDIDAFKWTRPAASMLQKAYPPERFTGVVWGDSHSTIPKLKASQPDFGCDVMFIDGRKDGVGKLRHIADMTRHATRPRTVVLIDDCNFDRLSALVPLECSSDGFSGPDSVAPRAGTQPIICTPKTIADTKLRAQGELATAAAASGPTKTLVKVVPGRGLVSNSSEGAAMAVRAGLLRLIECRWAPRVLDGWARSILEEGMCLAEIAPSAEIASSATEPNVE